MTRLPIFRILAGLSALAFLAACGSEDSAGGEEPVPFEEENDAGGGEDVEEEPTTLVPHFYQADGEGNPSHNAPELTVIASSAERIANPNDLAFHPDADRADELWVINEDTAGTGGSTVTIFDAGSDDQDELWLRDGNAWHFMAMPTALAFGENGHWATGTGLQDNNQAGGTWAGPSLWSSDFDIYAAVHDPDNNVNGSHLDMLHGSPHSMGIAYEEGNAYWVYDGYHEHIVLYDFVEPHYPGGFDHSNGQIFRHAEVEVERHESLPSHMIVDRSTNWLYINDTGNNRVLRLDTTSGEWLRDLPDTGDQISVHWEMQETTFEVFADSGLNDPTGIALHDGTLFVSNTGTGELIAFDTETGDELDRVSVGDGVRGITVGPDDKLWLANHSSNRILRLDPQ